MKLLSDSRINSRLEKFCTFLVDPATFITIQTPTKPMAFGSGVELGLCPHRGGVANGA